MPESVYMGQLHLSKACWELWLSDDQPHSDYNGQWQRALCVMAVMQSSQPNPQGIKKRKMYAIKQIKINAEYRDMLPRPRLDLSGTPGSWLTNLGLGSRSRYSAQILICIIIIIIYIYISAHVLCAWIINYIRYYFTGRNILFMQKCMLGLAYPDRFLKAFWDI